VTTKTIQLGLYQGEKFLCNGATKEKLKEVASQLLWIALH